MSEDCRICAHPSLRAKLEADYAAGLSVTKLAQVYFRSTRMIQGHFDHLEPAPMADSSAMSELMRLAASQTHETSDRGNHPRAGKIMAPEPDTNRGDAADVRVIDETPHLCASPLASLPFVDGPSVTSFWKIPPSVTPLEMDHSAVNRELVRLFRLSRRDVAWRLEQCRLLREEMVADGVSDVE